VKLAPSPLLNVVVTFAVGVIWRAETQVWVLAAMGWLNALLLVLYGSRMFRPTWNVGILVGFTGRATACGNDGTPRRRR